MPMQTVGKFSLTNQGGFVVKIEFQYLDHNGNRQVVGESGAIDLGNTKTVDPGDYGVPDGSITWLYVDVIWGENNLAQQAFLYARGNAQTASFVISGNALDNHLGLRSVN